MMREPMRDCRYREQQTLFNQLAEQYGFCAYRPDYHAKPRDANTVLFYTLADEKHNRQVDRQPTRYSRSEAKDRMQAGIHIDEKHIYRDPFFSFENTDANGYYNTGFGNHGTIDLRGAYWASVLTGAVLLPFIRKQQREYAFAAGGMLGIRECDDIYNNYNRSIIHAFALRHGKAYLGNFNFYDDARIAVTKGERSIYEEYELGKPVLNFGCAFVVPTPDEELQEMIRQWNSGDQHQLLVDTIMNHIDKLGGIHLVWY